MFSRLLGLVFCVAIFSGCTSSTVIKSVPSGAKLYVDGALVGKTPYTYSDTKFIGSSTRLELKKNGCSPWTGLISRNEKFEIGPCIGGVFVYVPFLWIMGYHPMRTYELECGSQTSIFERGNIVAELAKGKSEQVLQSSCYSLSLSPSAHAEG
jgi:hypothetical protein